MPELPDVQLYIERLAARLGGEPLVAVQVVNPNVLRTVQPPLADLVGRRVIDLQRIGKQIVFEFEAERFVVVHLMIAGRFHWKPPGARPNRKMGLAAFEFPKGVLLLTETSSLKRAALHVVQGRSALAAFQRGGIEPLEADLETFSKALGTENHTLKRALTDPRLIAGIGNAYSDEILHRARLSPLRLTRQVTATEWQRLYAATQATLRTWIERLRAETGVGFPEKVTAFRDGMAVHGRYRQLCPDCGSPVQRIRYAANECNYCATCQTEGRLLADRSLSRLLKDDWPRSLEDMEEINSRLRGVADATPRD